MVKCNFHRSTVIKSFFSAESTWPGMTSNDLDNAKSTSIQIRSTITFVDKKVPDDFKILNKTPLDFLENTLDYRNR